MGRQLSLILIRGDHRSIFNALMQAFDFTYIGNEVRKSSLNDTFDHILGRQLYSERSIECKSISYCKGWTVLIDQERELIWKTDVLKNISRALKAPVFALSCYDYYGWYQFSYFDGDKEREFIIYRFVDIIDDRGTPLEVESTFKTVSEFDLFKVTESVSGIGYEDLVDHHDFLIREFKKENWYSDYLLLLGQVRNSYDALEMTPGYGL